MDTPSAKQRRRRRRKARSRALKGCDGEPLPEYFVSDHPRHKWLFQLSEVQLQIPADALLEQLKAGRIAKERRGGVTSMKRARRPIPPREPPPSSTAPAHARRTGPPGVEAMLAHAMAALPPESESVLMESSADEDDGGESQEETTLSLRLPDPESLVEPEPPEPMLPGSIGGAGATEAEAAGRRHVRIAHATMRHFGCALQPGPNSTARDTRSAAERRLADKVRSEWTGFEAQTNPFRLGTPLREARGLGSPTSVNAVVGGELTESSFGHVSLDFAAARLETLRESFDRDIIERNKIVPSLERRRELARLAIVRSRAQHLSATRRAADQREAFMSRRIEDAERWEARARERAHAIRLTVWLGVVSIAARAQLFRSQPKADATMRVYASAACVLQRRARRIVAARIERRFREACKDKFHSAITVLKRRRIESREAATAQIKLFLHDIKLSSTGMSKAILHFRYKVMFCQRLAKAWITCLRTRRACLDRMLTSIERQLLDDEVIADGFVRRGAAAGAAVGGSTAGAARSRFSGARHLALFGSAIPPAERKRIISTLLTKAKRDYFRILQRKADKQRNAENAVFHVDMSSIKAMMHEAPGPPDGPPPRVSPRRPSQTVRPRDAALASREDAPEAPSPYLAVFSNLREPLTKIVKAAYRAHREQRMLKGAEQDRRLVVQVDGILAQPLSIRDAARIPAIVSKIEAMRGYH